MSIKKKATLESVIGEMLNDPNYDSPCTMMALVHLVGISSSEEDVHTVKLGSGGKQWSPTELANLFMGKAEVHCQDMTGTQAYKILAFYGTNEAQVKHRFVVAGRGDENHGITEPPTKEGRTMQDMRITEAVVLMAMKTNAHLVEMLTNRLEKSEERNVAAFDLAEKVLMSKYEQEIKLQRSMMWNKALDRGMTLLPAVANQLTGREVFPQGTADSAIIDAVAEHIKPEQIEAFASMFPPEVSGVIVATLRKRFEKIEREKKAMMVREVEVEVDAAEAAKH